MFGKTQRWGWLIFCLVAGLLIAGPLAAQQAPPEDTTRDPLKLAQRLLGVEGTAIVLDPTPIYEPGQKQNFWVNKRGSEQPMRITALLVISTPNLYIWLEEGLSFNAQNMTQMAQQMSNVWNAIRRYSRLGNLQGFDPLLPLPDVANDPHLNILYSTDLDDTRDTIYNPNNNLLAQYVPGKFSNEQELLIVNASKYAGTPPSDPLYVGILTRAFYNIVTRNQTPNQAPWLREALSWNIANQLQLAGDIPQAVSAFLQNPVTSLAARTATQEVIGMQQLFLAYVQQRISLQIFVDLYKQAGDGMTALDTLLETNNILDPVTQNQVTGRDLFADFVMTNMVNRPFGDGRYFYLGQTLLDPGQQIAPLSLGDFASVNVDQVSLNQVFQNQTGSGLAVNQFGTYYFSLDTTQPMTLTLDFVGADTVTRLPLPASDERFNHFYWSGNGRNRDNTLTRSFALRNVDSATLTFDTWYDLAQQWNYTYIEVSVDNGQTWTIIPATHTSNNNGNGVAYGPGFTGMSDPNGVRRFPYLGINFDPPSGQITTLVPDGPVARAGLRLGDAIIGYNGQPWPGGQVDLLGLLANYDAGDMLNLLIRRGTEEFDAPVILGEHPTRVFIPSPQWLHQTADLTPFAGNDVLVRFNYISLPDMENSGIAIDNIAIPEIGYADDAESDEIDWTMTGWQRINNQVPQRFLVQVATLGEDTFPITTRQLISPEDDATTGRWNIVLEPGQQLRIAVSGLNDNTSTLAPFDLILSKVNSGPRS